MSDLPDLSDLQRVLDHEIPMCREMGIQALPWGAVGDSTSEPALRMAMPLERNRNHQQTAFAGSLNALCTITGWGATYLHWRRLAAHLRAGEPSLDAVIVIRRSSIKYQEPVTSAQIVASCRQPAPQDRDHFAEMLAEKGQAKLNLEVEVSGDERHAVIFSGSYVVMLEGASGA